MSLRVALGIILTLLLLLVHLRQWSWKGSLSEVTPPLAGVASSSRAPLPTGDPVDPVASVDPVVSGSDKMTANNDCDSNDLMFDIPGEQMVNMAIAQA